MDHRTLSLNQWSFRNTSALFKKEWDVYYLQTVYFLPAFLAFFPILEGDITFRFILADIGRLICPLISPSKKGPARKTAESTIVHVMILSHFFTNCTLCICCLSTVIRGRPGGGRPSIGLLIGAVAIHIYVLHLHLDDGSRHQSSLWRSRSGYIQSEVVGRNKVVKIAHHVLYYFSLA